MPKRKAFYPWGVCMQCLRLFTRRESPSGRLESIQEFQGRKFCSRKCYGKYNTGENHWYWKGGFKKRPDGYIRLSKSEQYWHRKLIEDFIGRKLKENEFVHHINGDVTDNRITNLQIISNSAHRKLHCVEQQRDGMGRWCRRA